MLNRVHSIALGICFFNYKNMTYNYRRIIVVGNSLISFNTCLKHTLNRPMENLRWKSNARNENSSLSELKSNPSSQLTIGQKVKQTTKDASYIGIIIAGIGITGVMIYAIFHELFSGQSPNSVYTEALKLCRNDQKLVDILGEPIKGYGELSSRGRRRHVSHVEYEKDGKKYMRMKFYVEGIRKKGTVQLEVKQGSAKKYEYRYLFVDIEGYPPKTLVLKDNRHEDINIL